MTTSTTPAAILGTRVDVYFNLRTERWSIRQKGKVIAHADRVELSDATPVISESARLRVVANKCREVHAVIRGTLVSIDGAARPESTEAVSYNPYRAPTFYYCADGAPWQGSSHCYFESKRAWSAR